MSIVVDKFYNNEIVVFNKIVIVVLQTFYRGADKSLAPPTSRCILFDGENISFDVSLVIYIYI